MDILFSLLSSDLFYTEPYLHQPKTKNDKNPIILNILEFIPIFLRQVAMVTPTQPHHHTRAQPETLDTEAVATREAETEHGITLLPLERDGWQATGGTDEIDDRDDHGGDQAAPGAILIIPKLTTITTIGRTYDQPQILKKTFRSPSPPRSKSSSSSSSNSGSSGTRTTSGFGGTSRR